MAADPALLRVIHLPVPRSRPPLAYFSALTAAPAERTAGAAVLLPAWYLMRPISEERSVTRSLEAGCTIQTPSLPLPLESSQSFLPSANWYSGYGAPSPRRRLLGAAGGLSNRRPQPAACSSRWGRRPTKVQRVSTGGVAKNPSGAAGMEVQAIPTTPADHPEDHLQSRPTWFNSDVPAWFLWHYATGCEHPLCQWGRRSGEHDDDPCQPLPVTQSWLRPTRFNERQPAWFYKGWKQTARWPTQYLIPPNGPATLGRPLVRPPAAGCHVPVDRRQRMGESVALAGGRP